MRSENFNDCNELQLISSDSLTPFVYTTRCRVDFNLNKEWNSGSAEYANLKICILQNERFEDCNKMQLISSDSLTPFVYTTRCRDDFNLSKEYYSGSAEYANLKICILQNERLKDCNDMQLISSDSLTLFIYTTRCRNDFNLNKE